MASSIAWRSASMAALTAGDASCGIGENVGVRAGCAGDGAGVGAAMCAARAVASSTNPGMPNGAMLANASCACELAAATAEATAVATLCAASSSMEVSPVAGSLVIPNPPGEANALGEVHARDPVNGCA